MKSTGILAAVSLLFCVSATRADVFLNFEDLPTGYNSDYGAVAPSGDIAGHYSPYVYFGPNVEGTTGTTWLPVIGNNGILNTYDGVYNNTPPGTLGFTLTGALGAANAGVTGVSFWYSSLNNLFVQAYNANNVLVASGTATKNSVLFGTGTGPSFFSLSAAGISSISISDGTGFGGNFVLDDINISSSNVPDVSNTFGLLGLAGAGLLAFRRKTVAA